MACSVSHDVESTAPPTFPPAFPPAPFSHLLAAVFSPLGTRLRCWIPLAVFTPAPTKEQQSGTPGRCHVVLLTPRTGMDVEAVPDHAEVGQFFRVAQYVIQPLQARLSYAYVLLFIIPPLHGGYTHTGHLGMTHTGPTPVPRLRSRGHPAASAAAAQDSSPLSVVRCDSPL